MAIVSGRKSYANEWGLDEKGYPKIIDIGPAYDNMKSITKTLRCLGFKEIKELFDPTKEEMTEAFRDMQKMFNTLKKDD